MMRFQYPQPDRYPCNPMLNLFRMVECAHTFSILNRIDIPATISLDNALSNERKLSVSSTGSISLQLSHLYRGHAYLLALSVSSTGSISLQLTNMRLSPKSCLLPSFSILNRIDIPATATLSGEGSTLFSHFWPYRRFFWPLSASFLQRIRCLLYHSATSSKTVFCPEMGGIFEYT